MIHSWPPSCSSCLLALFFRLHSAYSFWGAYDHEQVSAFLSGVLSGAASNRSQKHCAPDGAIRMPESHIERRCC